MSPMYPFVHLRFAQVFNTLSNDWFLTAPPPMADLTLRLNPSLFDRRSSAASLFKGSAAFGSRKRNYRQNISRPAPSLLGALHFAYLEPDNHSLQIQHWLPILSQNIKADVSFQIDVRVVYLLRTFDLRRLMGETLTDREREVESATFVHAFIRFDCECEVERIVGVGEVGFHGAW
jgi:hypothetical protein